MTSPSIATSTRTLAEATAWRLDGLRSELRFTAHQMGMTVRGRFPAIQGSVELHLDRLEDSAIDASIRTDAVEPAMDSLRGLLLSDAFLAAATYPELRFRSGLIEADGDAYLVHGELTFRGLTRPISFQARLVAVDALSAGMSVRIEARGRIDHLIADERLEVELALVAVPATGSQPIGDARITSERPTSPVATTPASTSPDERPLRVVALLGSLRRASLNGSLLRAVREVAPAGLSIEPFQLSGVPFYDGDLEGDAEPEAVTRLKAAITGADALLIVTPEYNHGLPAVIKNAIDWASRPPFGSPLVGKPVLLIGATTGRSAAKYALEEATAVLASAQAAPFETRYGVSQAADLIDEHGRLADPRVHAELRELLGTFERSVRRTAAITTTHLAA